MTKLCLGIGSRALGDLNQSVVFVGGAVISLYADDPATDEVRPTQDVDLTLKLLDFNQREVVLTGSLRGYHPDIHGHAICTYKYNDSLWISWPQLIQCEDRRIAGI